MSIAAAASMPWLNVCSVYRSRGISTRRAQRRVSQARAILADTCPACSTFSLSRNSSWTTNQYENFADHTTLASHERFRHLPAEEEHFARLPDGRPQLNCPWSVTLPGRSWLVPSSHSARRLDLALVPDPYPRPFSR